MNLDNLVNQMEKEIEATNNAEKLKKVKNLIQEGKDPNNDWCTFLYDITKTSISKDKIELLKSLYNYIDPSKYKRSDGWDAYKTITKYHWYYSKSTPIYIQQIKSTDDDRMGVSISLREIDGGKKESIQERIKRARTYLKIGSQNFYCLEFSTGYGTGLDGVELYYMKDGYIYIRKKDIDIINKVDISIIGNDLAKDVMILRGKEGQYIKHKGYTID